MTRQPLHFRRRDCHVQGRRALARAARAARLATHEGLGEFGALELLAHALLTRERRGCAIRRLRSGGRGLGLYLAGERGEHAAREGCVAVQAVGFEEVDQAG